MRPTLDPGVWAEAVLARIDALCADLKRGPVDDPAFQDGFRAIWRDCLEEMALAVMALMRGRIVAYDHVMVQRFAREMYRGNKSESDRQEQDDG